MQVMLRIAAEHVMIGSMLRTILREILIFVGCLVFFSLAAAAIFSYTHSLDEGIRILARGMFAFPLSGQKGRLVFLLLELSVPYFVVQAVRAFYWSRTGPVARKWAHLYFTLIMLVIGGSSFWKAWDLLYFMYALGDLPEEILQFLELQGTNLIVSSMSFFIALVCFRVFLNPDRYGAGDSRNTR
jgi:hypothetical protein